MSGIWGVLHRDGKPVDADHIAGMGRASRARAVDGEAVWSDGAAAVGHHSSRITPESIDEEQPLVANDLVVSFDGRIDNRSELRAWCGVQRSDAATMSDAAFVRAAYRTFGDACAAKLAGDFAFALLDRRQRKLILARDIMAARPLYYVELPGGVAFASEIKALLAHPQVPTAPDPDGLADLLLNGYCDGHTTWFDRIRSVPPGSIVVVSPDRLQVSQVWEFPTATVRYASHADYVAHFQELFVQAVARRVRSAHPVAVAVSGGIDSSAIQCAAAAAGGAPVAGFTMAFPRGSAADEHEYVRVLRDRGLAIEDVPVEDVRWLVTPERGVGQMELPCIAWREYDVLLARARQAGCRVLLNGFFGDQVLTGEAYLVDLAWRGRWGLIRRHLRSTAAWMDDVDPRLLRRRVVQGSIRALLPPAVRHMGRTVFRRTLRRSPYASWFTRSFRERALERTLGRGSRPRRYASAHAEEVAALATSGHYLSAVLQSGSAGAAHGLDTAFPFRDRDLVAFLLAIPGDAIMEDGVPKGLMRRALQGILPDAIRLRRNKGDGTGFSNRAALAEEPAMRELVAPGCLAAAAGFIDRDVLRSQWPMIFGDGLRRDDTAELGWQIGDTYALELWLRRFCAGAACN